MLEFARWKYILVAVVLLLAALFALPNVFGEDAALQVARKDRAAVAADGQRSVEDFLRGKGVTFSRSYIDDGRLMLHFAEVPEQLKARDLVNENFARDYVTALSFASRAPDWPDGTSARGADARTGARRSREAPRDGGGDPRRARRVPPATCALLSLALTIVLWLLRRWRG